MKLINLQNKARGNFTIYCRETLIGSLRNRSRTSDHRKLRATIYYQRPSLLENRLANVNKLLSKYDFVEPLELITHPALLSAGPAGASKYGFYLEIGNIGWYLPVLHGILGYLRGGKTSELALARASLQTCESIDYNHKLEESLHFDGAQSFLSNIWPGIWAEDFTKALKRYKKPDLDTLFTSVWAHYMGFVVGVKPALPWGLARVDRVVLDSNHPHILESPTYFINHLRAYGVDHDGLPYSARLTYTRLTEPYNMFVYIYPDSIFNQIPFIGKPGGEND